MKTLSLLALLLLLPSLVFAANPSYSSFPTSQFATDNTNIAIKLGAVITNLNVAGTPTGNIVPTNGAAGFTNTGPTSLTNVNNVISGNGAGLTGVPAGTNAANVLTNDTRGQTNSGRSLFLNTANMFSGTNTNVTLVSCRTMPTNVYVITNLFSYTNGQPYVVGAAGCFATGAPGTGGTMRPGYSISFGGYQAEIMKFNNANPALATIAYVNPFPAATSNNVLSFEVSPNAIDLLDNNGTWLGAIDGGGQVLAPGWESQGLTILALDATNSMSLSTFSTDADGNPCLNFSSLMYSTIANGEVTIAIGCPGNTLALRKNGDVTAYGGNIIMESAAKNIISLGGITVAGSETVTNTISANSGVFNSLTVSNGVTPVGTAYSQSGLTASVAKTMLYTNSTGSNQFFELKGEYEITTASTTGTLTVTFAYTNLQGAQTYTIGPVSTATAGSSSISPISLLVSNATAVTFTTTLVNTSGAATYETTDWLTK